MMRLMLAALLGLAATAPAPLWAQGVAYPSKTITLIAPFSAGGTADVFARMVAGHLQGKWGQPVVVENIGGAGGILGVTKLARSRPDGTTIGLASTSTLAINPSLHG